MGRERDFNNGTAGKGSGGRDQYSAEVGRGKGREVEGRETGGNV